MHPDEVVPDIENGYMNAIYWAGDKLSDFYSLFNGPAPGTVAHYSGIANSTVAYYGAPATGSGVSFLGSGSGWNNPPVFSPIPMSQETVPLLLPPATPPPKTTDNPSSSTGGTVTKPSQGSSGKGGVWIK